MKNHRWILLAAVCTLVAITPAYSQTQATETKDYDNPNEYDQTLAFTPQSRNSLPSVRILLNQITRLLEDQRVELVVEVRNPPGNGTFVFTVNGVDISKRFSATATTMDCNGTPGIVYRANAAMGFPAGTAVLTANVDGYVDTRSITVYPFTLNTPNRNLILFLGDAMGTAYRDASRIVYKSVLGPGGQANFVEGFFSDLQQMDKMPISGMSMTYSTDAVVPDSANTAATWSTGNKTFNAALGVTTMDGDDCVWEPTGPNQANLATVLDNPKVETLWEYMKRKYNYATGIVSTADITDATPAGEGSHTASRQTRFEIARQYLNNPFLGGRPGFDVIIGGGTDQFAACRNDGRNLIHEFQAQGYKYVTTASELAGLNPSSRKVLALVYAIPGNQTKSNGVQCNLDGNMTVAYDKLGLVRPASEVPTPIDGNTDQPFLDAMTKQAINFLSSGGRPFILMVEGASIDKQSHANMASGQIWDTIELDKAVGVGRAWAAAQGNTLVLVTADHDQSMSINGVSEIPQENYVDKNVSATLVYDSPGAGEQTAKYFQDSAANIRSSYPLINSSDPNATGKATGPEFGPFQNPITESNFPNYVDSDGDGYPDNVNLGTTGNIRLSVGYRSGNHAGSSVPITAEGPGAFLFTGYMDQSDIMFKAAVSLGGDTTAGDTFVKTILLNPRYPQTPGKHP